MLLQHAQAVLRTYAACLLQQELECKVTHCMYASSSSTTSTTHQMPATSCPHLTIPPTLSFQYKERYLLQGLILHLHETLALGRGFVGCQATEGGLQGPALHSPQPGNV